MSGWASECVCVLVCVSVCLCVCACVYACVYAAMIRAYSEPVCVRVYVYLSGVRE